MNSQLRRQALLTGLAGTLILFLSLLSIPAHSHSEPWSGPEPTSPILKIQVSAGDTDCNLCIFTRNLCQADFHEQVPSFEPSDGSTPVLIVPTRIVAAEITLAPSRAPPALTPPTAC
jgi:hypothetical protein